MEPKDRPLVCLASKIRLHEYNVGCCSNDDLCNQNLTVEFVPKAGQGDDTATMEGNKDCSDMELLSRSLLSYLTSLNVVQAISATKMFEIDPVLLVN